MRRFYHIAGIQRATVYSPHSEDKDYAIFLEVLKQLEALGHEVKVYQEEDLIAGVVEECYIYNMVRSEDAIAKLQALEKTGNVVINSGYGIEHCRRETMTTFLLNNGIPFAPSMVYDLERISTANVQWSTFNGQYWIKKADGYTVEPNDVVFVSEPSHLQQVLDSFALRGICRVVVSKHLDGDLVKFYGVAGTDFFFWFYPYQSQHSKFGQEIVNGAPTGICFSEENLKAICSKAAQVLGVEVFGGDAVIATDGTIRLIDFNDWPSFSPCREEAGNAIAQAIIKKIERNVL